MQSFIGSNANASDNAGASAHAISSAVAELQPQPLWRLFAEFNAVPRPSKNEARAVHFVERFAASLGLPFQTDATGNVLVRKPASQGREGHPTVALQSHLDMVHQQNAGRDFEFDLYGIEMELEGDWVKARGTTLGADNGIGVAACMAVLASDLPHPPLEVLFTVDEETGMTGAKGLSAGTLQARTLLNTDSEDESELTIGCAGGVDVVAEGTYPMETGNAAAEGQALLLEVRGATGGHSGMDIHRGRANANLLLAALLRRALEAGGKLVWVDGGGLRNALPREARALVLLPAGASLSADGLSEPFRETDPALTCEVRPAVDEDAGRPVEDSFARAFVQALESTPHGVHSRTPGAPELVQTSNNLARVKLQNGHFEVACLTRGSVDAEKLSHAEAVGAPWRALGAKVHLSGDYPGWAPRPEARVVALMSECYRELFGSAPHVTACHAGLECGILGSSHPDMEMISFGPNIRGAHSPDERVQISSVGRFWRLLCRTLERL